MSYILVAMKVFRLIVNVFFLIQIKKNFFNLILLQIAYIFSSYHAKSLKCTQSIKCKGWGGFSHQLRNNVFNEEIEKESSSRLPSFQFFFGQLTKCLETNKKLSSFEQKNCYIAESGMYVNSNNICSIWYYNQSIAKEEKVKYPLCHRE